MAAYYNEIDPFAAQWLRNLIAAGHIAPGDVDERSIEDVKPDDLRQYTQCHFFAGIGVWSYSLRRAGWLDDKPVWTGSCPCQPFSAAGKKRGFDDTRHLWPHMFRLIAERRPGVVFGEQVASNDGLQWFDAVQTDLENANYAATAVDLCAAGVGAPHIRQRLFWVADANGMGRFRRGSSSDCNEPGKPVTPTGCCSSSWMAHGYDNRQQPGAWGSCGGQSSAERDDIGRCCEVSRMADNQRAGCGSSPTECTSTAQLGQKAPTDVGTRGGACGLADTNGSKQRSDSATEECIKHASPRRQQDPATATGLCGDSRALQVNGFWRDADWLFCQDGKWRSVEPGTFPLAHGITSRVGRLRAYGNAINAEVATIFISAYMECRNNV